MSQSVQRAITLIQRSAQGPLSLAEAANLLDVLLAGAPTE